jgi:hypothetical protein
VGNSLLSIVSLISRGLGAGVFAGMSDFYDIGGALVPGAAIVLTGCLALAFLDARRDGVG